MLPHVPLDLGQAFINQMPVQSEERGKVLRQTEAWKDANLRTGEHESLARPESTSRIDALPVTILERDLEPAAGVVAAPLARRVALDAQTGEAVRDMLLDACCAR